MNYKAAQHFKSVKDFLVFVLLYTYGEIRVSLLGLEMISDYDNWYNQVKQTLFPITDEAGLEALNKLSELYEELKNGSVENNELVKLVNEAPTHTKPKKDKKDTFIIMESGINFRNDNMYLCEKVFVAFPSNSVRLKTIRHYCIDIHDKRFYCLKPWTEETKPFSFRDVEHETGYMPAIGADRASAGINYLKVNKLVEEI